MQNAETLERAPRIWVIVGATGTGKSELSLDLAEALRVAGRNAEIVNADAMQLYRGMNIGTAKLPVADRRGIPHHMFDVLEPHEESTVAEYQQQTRTVIRRLLAEGTDVILVGGSGLYVSSVIFEFSFPPRDAAVRAEIEAAFDEAGIAPLLDELRHRAPSVASAVDQRNPRRVIRALEVARLGSDPSVTLPAAPVYWQPEETSMSSLRIIGIACDRATLVQRLDARVERMWEHGLLEEVSSLMPQGLTNGPTASRAIGYAQALGQLAGRFSEAEAIAETQMLTRRYARRQVSWFRRYADAMWIDGPDLAAVIR